MNKNNVILCIQKGLNEKEIEIAKVTLNWFIKEIFSGRDHFDSKTNSWVYGVKVPSWKHLTNGGHRRFALSRGSFGILCSTPPSIKKEDIELASNLVFRRTSNSKREFGVVRKETLEIGDNNVIICACKTCSAQTKVNWKNGIKPDLVVVFTAENEI